MTPVLFGSFLQSQVEVCADDPLTPPDILSQKHRFNEALLKGKWRFSSNSLTQPSFRMSGSRFPTKYSNDPDPDCWFDAWGSPEDVCPDLGCDFAAEATVNLEEWPGPDWQGRWWVGGMMSSWISRKRTPYFGGKEILHRPFLPASFKKKLSGHWGKDGWMMLNEKQWWAHMNHHESIGEYICVYIHTYTTNFGPKPLTWCPV